MTKALVILIHSVAMAGNLTIAEVEEIVPLGELDPDEIMTPGVFVHSVVPSQGVNWKWVWRYVIQIAKRAAAEIKTGMVVNLGIGIPSLVPNFLKKEQMVMFHAENGIVGWGQRLKKGKKTKIFVVGNAGGLPVTVIQGASYCDSSIAFGMIRKGMIDMTILGALQVSEEGIWPIGLFWEIRCPAWEGRWSLHRRRKRLSS